MNLAGNLLIRVVRTPRLAMFTPLECKDTSDPCPVPLKWLDVTRYTKTDSDAPSEQRIHDVWCGTDEDLYELSMPWTGEVQFDLLREKPKHGYEYAMGRRTRKEG